MSIFDEERKKLGLPTSSGVSSFLQSERERVLSGQKTRFQEIKDRNVDNQRSMGAYLNDPRKNEPIKKKTNTKTSEKSTKQTKSKGLLDDLKATGKATVQFFNPFDDVSAEEAVNNLLNHKTSKTFDEVARGSNRLVDSASLGAMSNLDKRVNNREPYYNSERKIGEGGGTDLITSGLGYLAPGIGWVKGVKALGLGSKTVPELAEGANWLNKVTRAAKVGSQIAKEGAIVGSSMGLAEVGIREGLNSDDYNWKQNLGHVGFGAVTGAVADPLLHGVGKGLSMGAETVANRTMKNLLPDNAQVGKNLGNTLKTFEAERVPVQDFPNMSNTPKPSALNELLPQANDIANPNIVRPLNTVKPQEPIVNSPYKRFDGTEQPKVETPIQEPTPQDPTTFKRIDTVTKESNERGFINTLKNSEKSTEPFLERLKGAYEPLSNEKVVELANQRVSNNVENAVNFVKTAKKVTPEHVATAHRLIDEFQKSGQFERAVDIAETIAEQGTKAGQSVQAFSIYNRLTPEGQLVRAQRRVNQINQNIGKTGQKVVITKDAAAKITDTADSIQRLTGTEDISKDVMSLMDKVKKGTTLTDGELETVRSFVSDAKKFIGDLTPKAERPKPKKVDTRTRDKVVDFMSKQEEVAMKRLKERMNRANSLPVDVFYDLSIIGASKIAKGTVKFADFTEQMVKDFGEEIRPYMQQIYDKAVDTFNLQSESVTRRRLSEVEKITNKALKDKSLSEDEAEVLKEFARRVGTLTGDAKLEASQELQATLMLLERPTLGQKISTAQTIAQLLNPKTIVRNAIGNEMFYRVERMSKYIATPIDWSRSKITGKERSVTFRTYNQGQYWRNWMIGLKSGWRGVNPEGIQTQYDLGSPAFRSKFNPMTYFEKTLGATLRSFDYAGYKRAYNKTIGELATLKAMNQGLKGKQKREAIQQFIREADENMVHIADKYSKYATFQDNTALSNALQKVKHGANKLTTGSKDFGLGDLILKYPKTPGNLIMRALEYSPIGFIRSAKIFMDPLRKNVPFESDEFAMSIARGIMGTAGFSLMGFVLANKGILTSGGNSDFEVASLERLAGKQANSINVDAFKRFIVSGFNESEAETREGDTFISYDWAQPISMSIALGTGISQSAKEEEELDGGKAIKSGIDSAYNTIIEQSVLSGLNDFLASYPGRTLSDRFADAGKNLVSSFVPTLSNQFKQLNNNNTRTTYSPNVLEEMKNRSINRVPNLDSVLPPSYDTLGNQRQTFQNGSNNTFNVFFNPSFVSKYKPSEEAKFVLDFINQTGEKSVAPRMAKKYLTVDGKKIDLTGSQHAEMQRIMGEETKAGLERVVPKLQGETDFEKIRKALEKVLNGAGEKARKELKKEVGE